MKNLRPRLDQDARHPGLLKKLGIEVLGGAKTESSEESSSMSRFVHFWRNRVMISSVPVETRELNGSVG